MLPRTTLACSAALLALTAACSTDAPTAPATRADAPGVLRAVITASGDAVIDNGTIKLGVDKNAFLVVKGQFSPTDRTRDSLGLVYMPTNGEGLAWPNTGTSFDGWGVAAFFNATQSVRAFAGANSPSAGYTLTSFTATDSTATSVAQVDRGGAPFVRVTHHFRPTAATRNLYELAVTFENLSSTPIPDLRYTRALDWYIAGTTATYSTMQGSALDPNVVRTTDGGASLDPVSGGRGPQTPGAVGDFVDVFANRHGAHMDLALGELAAGASKTVYFYYGAAAGEAAAVSAVSAVGARTYALGQSVPAGTPVTFVLAFQGRTNAPPVPKINGPFTISLGESVSLSAAGTTDPDGDAVTYAWDFGDGQTGTGQDVTHTYTLARSSFTVTLTVTDARGATATATTLVTIAAQNQPPIARANGPYAGPVNGEIAFSSAGSADPEGGALTYAWEFGDGQTSTEASPKHVYVTAGTYTARLTVRDPQGLVGTDAAEVTIGGVNRAPVAGVAFSKRPVLVGETVTITPSASDPDGDTPLACTVSFGDGRAAVGPRSCGDPGIETSYAAPGLYTVTVTARDPSNASGTTADTIRVLAPETNTPPEIVSLRAFPEGMAAFPIAGTSCYAREQVCVKYTIRDVDAGDNPFATTVNWGDGSPTYVPNAVPAENIPLLAYHTYAAAGTYTVTVTATDRRGASSTRTVTLTIAP
jgi:PKD repeat protein